jgi:GTP-binding protein
MDAPEITETDEGPRTSGPAPVVTIIGRPNVGKSTLFNRLVGERRAIVGDEPGITRDRIYGSAEWQGRVFDLIDTGGIVPDDEAIIPSAIFKQARTAIEDAALLLFVVDVRQGPTSLDEELARRLRRTGRPVLVVANKAETSQLDADAQEFTRWGFDDVVPVSSEHGQGVGDLLDAIAARVELVEPGSGDERETNIAIIGRPNVGKSSLVNRLLGEERAIVSPIPGTTRDAVDTRIDAEGHAFRLIDTAGIRRKGKTELMAEKLSVVMARRHLERADVAFHLVDAVEGPTNLDATIAGYAHEAGCSTIILVNKWDLVPDKETNTHAAFERRIREEMKFNDYAPIIFVSALTGQRTGRLLGLAARADEARHKRIGTGELNRFLEQYLDQPRASLPGRHQLKVRYITQARVAPPTFVLFTNARKVTLHFSYERYVENRLRENYEFFATPIRIVGRSRTDRPGVS